VVQKLNRTINDILQNKDFSTRAAALGVVRRGGTPQELGKFIQAEYDRWAPVLTELGLAKSM
jgi:tripartite-type tricarboxylate transporter receptor subunit TctC